jgi:hypothetical protein
MKPFRKSDPPTFLPLPHILTHAETELLRQNTLLRDHVALLVSTNVDLLRQLEELSSRDSVKTCQCMTGRALASALTESRHKAQQVRARAELVCRSA